MTRSVYLSLAAVLFAGAMQAQAPPPAPAPAPEPQPRTRPRAGTIIDNPNAGRITEAPKPPGTVPPGTNVGDLAGKKVERFEAVGNSSVASDTIRVYLGLSPGEPYDPAALRTK